MVYPSFKIRQPKLMNVLKVDWSGPGFTMNAVRGDWFANS